MGRSAPHPACYRFSVAGSCRCHGRDLMGGAKPVTGGFSLSGWCMLSHNSPPYHLHRCTCCFTCIICSTEWVFVSCLYPISSWFLLCLKSPVSVTVGCSNPPMVGLHCTILHLFIFISMSCEDSQVYDFQSDVGLFNVSFLL